MEALLNKLLAENVVTKNLKHFLHEKTIIWNYIFFPQLGTSCYDYFFLGIHDSITRRYDSASTYAQQMRWLKTAKENSDPGRFLA